MVAGAQERAEAIRSTIRARHAEAYAARELVRREHDEWPRFALVRFDRDDVLLTAACDLEPRRVEWHEFARAVDDCGGGWWPTEELVPPITVLTTAAACDWLAERRLLAGVLLRLQAELAHHEVVELRIGERTAIAARTRTVHLRGAEDLQPDATVEVHGTDPAPALSPDAGLPGLATGRLAGLPALPVPAHSHRFAQLHVDEFDTTLPWHGRDGARDVLLVAPWLRGDGAHRGAIALLRAMQQLDPAISLHLALTEDTDLGDVPLDVFETIRFTPLLAGADVVLHAAAPLPGAGEGAMHVALDEVAARGLDGLVDVYAAPTPTAAVRLANLEAVPDKIAAVPAATVWRPDDPDHSRRLAADKNRGSGAPIVLSELFTPTSLERADVVVLDEHADPTLALDAMAFGCLVIAVDAPQLADIVVHGETGLAVDRSGLKDTIADAAGWAAARDAGVELALATSWEPGARALLEALAAAAQRQQAVAA
jgi:hypothetical protein